jgi:hypothetical protein
MFPLFLLAAAYPGFGIPFSIDVGVNTYYLYHGYVAVFTPSLEAALRSEIPMSGQNPLVVSGSLRLIGGYRYFAEGQPMDFFIETAAFTLSADFFPAPDFGWSAMLLTTLDLRDFPTRSSAFPSVSFRWTPDPLFSAELGAGAEIFPWNLIESAVIPIFSIRSDLSSAVRFPLTISYSGRAGIRLNDYTYTVPNPSGMPGEPLLVPSADMHPYFSYYGHGLLLDFALSDVFSIRYGVGNRFVFLSRFLALSPYESMKSLCFTFDLVISPEEVLP